MCTNDEALITYHALLKVLRFDAALKASRYEKQSASPTTLNKIERSGFYAKLLKDLRSIVVFEAMELAKIKADLYKDSVPDSYMVGVISRKVLIVWTMEDIQSIQRS